MVTSFHLHLIFQPPKVKAMETKSARQSNAACPQLAPPFGPSFRLWPQPTCRRRQKNAAAADKVVSRTIVVI